MLRVKWFEKKEKKKETAEDQHLTVNRKDTVYKDIISELCIQKS